MMASHIDQPEVRLSDVEEDFTQWDIAEVLVPWSDLEDGLLELIIAHVTSPYDLFRCRGVCRSWRSAAIRVLSGGINNGAQKNIKYTAPLLLFSSKTTISHKDHRKLVYLDKNTIAEHRYYRAPDVMRSAYLMPEDDDDDNNDENGVVVADSENSTSNRSMRYNSSHLHKQIRCVASYCGWLLLYIYFDSSLYLFNPLSRMMVRLPTHVPPPVPKTVNDKNQLRFITSSALSDPTCMIYLYTTFSCVLAIYKIGDREWMPDFTAKHRWVSVILYKGNFYSVDESGVLRRFWFDEDGSGHKEEVVSNTTLYNSRDRYLVESWSGELLMVVRWLVRDMEGVSKTRCFEIFKLNWGNGEWEEMGDFGDQALFLSRNDSKFVRVRHKSEYRHNSIYFVDDLGRHANSGNEDYGVYDLGKREVEPLDLPHNNNLQCQWFQPVL